MEPTTSRVKGGRNSTAQRAVRRLRTVARHFLGDRGANVLITFALTLPVLLALVGAGIDYSYAEGSQTNLQDASDAAALAVAAEVVKNPNDTKTTLQALAQSVLNANYNGTPVPTITDFHVCAPVTPGDCTAASGSLPMDTVAISETATSPCTLAGLVPMICSGNPPGVGVSAATQTVIGFGATMQLNVIMDTSASMIVGSTASDVAAINTWVTQTNVVKNDTCTKGANGNTSKKQTCLNMGNWNTVHPNAQVADYAATGGAPCYGTYPSCTSNDNPPCAFVCHDKGGSTANSDVAAGLTDAENAGATTRFQVMISAANALISNIQTQLSNNSNLAKNTYLFNIYGFNTGITQYGSTNMACSATSCAGVNNAIAAVSPGLDTNLNTVMQTFSASSGTDAIGSNGTGSSSSSPLKFVILVTDGLQSDRDNNWSCSNWAWDTIWNYTAYQACFAGNYDQPINTSYCSALKSEGVVLAVLETPYVPLDGSDPDVQPYERTVRHTIYPGGSGSASTVSTALSNCATSGYYFQATSASQIATGFTQLTNQFIAQHSYLSK